MKGDVVHSNLVKLGCQLLLGSVDEVVDIVAVFGRDLGRLVDNSRVDVFVQNP